MTRLLDVPNAEIVLALRGIGCDAGEYHTGGGCWVVECYRDVTGRDSSQGVVWVTTDDGCFLVGVYADAWGEDPGAVVSEVAFGHTIAASLERLCWWFRDYAARTGEVLP